jgi:RimJ/RimL family protein N-acetyltransferase
MRTPKTPKGEMGAEGSLWGEDLIVWKKTDRKGSLLKLSTKAKLKNDSPQRLPQRPAPTFGVFGAPLPSSPALQLTFTCAYAFILNMNTPSDILYETEHLAARRIAEEHVKTICEWFNDERVSQFMTDPDERYDEEKIRHLFLKTGTDDLDVIFIEKKSGEMVGFASVYDINRKIGTCEMSLLIGNPSFRGRGLSHQIVKCMVHLIFDHLNLTNIFTTVVTENIPCRKAMLKAGFREIGTRSRTHIFKGKFYDEVLFEKLKEAPQVKTVEGGMEGVR